MTQPTAAAHQTAQDLLDFIDASPSPWHAVATCETRLRAAGYEALNETGRWSLTTGGRYYVTRGGSSIIAFIVGDAPLTERGLTMIGAHTDSPGLRIKPKPAEKTGGMIRLGVEVYGGPILATFADRDLSLAGRVNVRSASGIDSRLLRFDAPLLRLPNLAIHMNREVNEAGLKFNKQTELPLLLGIADEAADRRFRQPIAAALDVAPDDLLTWELAAYDTQKGALWGVDREFIADSQLDNLASCHATLSALMKKLAASIRRRSSSSRPKALARRASTSPTKLPPAPAALSLPTSSWSKKATRQVCAGAPVASSADRAAWQEARLSSWLSAMNSRSTPQSAPFCVS